MARIEEIRSWLANIGGNRDEAAEYIRRIETDNENLRRRNGELLTALQSADDDVAKSLTPIDRFPTRHVVIDRILVLAAELAYGAPVMDDLVEAVKLNDGYWGAVAEELRKRRERTEASRAKAALAKAEKMAS